MSDKIVIIGGGPVGAVLALALQQKGIASITLEARAQGAAHTDTRALALSYGSKLILEKLGVWTNAASAATAIHTIHVSQRGGLGRTLLKAEEHNLPALGYVLPYGALAKALDSVLAQSESCQIEYASQAQSIQIKDASAQVDFLQQNAEKILQTPLLIIADGGSGLSEMAGLQRETKEYGHHALVSKVRAELPHNNIAYERFTPQGPMALLPNGARDFSLVWTGEQASVEALLALDDTTFLRQLHVAFGDRVGQFLSVEKRIAFPLKLSTLKAQNAAHVAVIGNAAQTMHPVAGQGFNVGLRDAWTLAELIANTLSAQMGSAEMLKNYQQSRQRDTKGGVMFTDFLVNVFNNDLMGVSAMRGAGLGLLDIIKPAKRFLVDKMSFGK